MRYFIKLAYNGSGFHGWQRQPNASSVQENLEETLSRILREEIQVVGAGRTDTGVHARVMFAHFDIKNPIENKNRFIKSLNGLLNHNINVYDIMEVTDEAHARFDAISREYRYFVTHRRTPFLNKLSWFSPSELNYEKMNEAAEILLHTSDFTSFAKLHADTKTNICSVSRAEWIKEDLLGMENHVFVIKADRFLRNMVRSVVGTLIEVGRNKLDPEGFKKIIEQKDRCAAGTSMPAEALFLWEIEYPKNIYL